MLDNHSAHISKETQAYLSPPATLRVRVHAETRLVAEHRGNQFSKMTRTMLRGIRVASKQELIDRIHHYFEEINADPVIFRWKYKMDESSIV